MDELITLPSLAAAQRPNVRQPFHLNCSILLWFSAESTEQQYNQTADVPTANDTWRNSIAQWAWRAHTADRKSTQNVEYNNCKQTRWESVFPASSLAARRVHQTLYNVDAAVLLLTIGGRAGSQWRREVCVRVCVLELASVNCLKWSLAQTARLSCPPSNPSRSHFLLSSFSSPHILLLLHVCSPFMSPAWCCYEQSHHN